MATIFDAPAYLQAKTQQLNNDPSVDQTYTAQSTEQAINDAGLSLEQHYQQFGEKELSDAGISFQPQAEFDTSGYLEAKTQQLNNDADVEQEYTVGDTQQAIIDAGLNPQSHYEVYGKQELSDAGISFEPNAEFNTEQYLQAKTDQLQANGDQEQTVAETKAAIADAGYTPEEHYALFGQDELDDADISFTPSNDGSDNGDNGDNGNAGNGQTYSEDLTTSGNEKSSLEVLDADGASTVNLDAHHGSLPAPEDDTAYVDASEARNVTNLTSDHSDASLQVNNVTTLQDGDKEDASSGNTNDMTIGMDHTGSSDSDWAASDMTVYFEQDYLTSTQQQEGNFLNLLDREAYDKVDQGKTAQVEGFPLTGVEVSTDESGEYTVNTSESQLADVSTAQDLVNVLNQAADQQTPFGNDAFSVSGTFPDRDNLREGNSIVFNPDGESSNGFFVNIDNRAENGDIFYDQGSLASTTNAVATNVDLEKVGRSGDGGALEIGSMNKSGDNTFDGVTTTNDTVAGFQTLNVNVQGGYAESSSLSALQSTNNTLETVNVSSDGGDANLTIGNSNTDVETTGNGSNDTNFGSVKQNAQALKDVADFDASSFNGDLDLTAGLTNEVGAKYGVFDNELNDDGSFATAPTDGTDLVQTNPTEDNQQIDYQGGSGNDNIDIAVSNGVALASQPENGGVDLSVEGGDGNDAIDVSGSGNVASWTITGGAGDDTITLDDNTDGDFGSTVVFDQGTGQNANGADAVNNFNVNSGATATNEEQTLDLSGQTVDEGDSITLNIGGEDQSFENDTGSGTNAATVINGKSGDIDGYGTTDDGSGQLTVTQNGGNESNIGTITASEGTSSNGNTIAQADTDTNGASASDLSDVLDFSSYDVDGLQVEGSNVVGSGAADNGDTYINLMQGDGDNGIYDISQGTVQDGDNSVDSIGSVDLGANALDDADAANFAIA